MVANESTVTEADEQSCGFSQLPDALVLKIFATAEGQGGRDNTPDYEAISDDDLHSLIDGFQTRLGLPLVCKRWYRLLAQPSYVWEVLSIVLHEVYNVQQTFVGKQLFLQWLSKRAGAVRTFQLDFDEWCRDYYQGCFSAIQASNTIADALHVLQHHVQQLKLLDSGYVINRNVLQSIAGLTQLQHLQLFGIASQTLASANLSMLTHLSQLKNLQLSDNGDTREGAHLQSEQFFPVQICNLPHLVRLDIQSPLVTYIDAGITRMQKLRTLMVSGCAIQQVPAFLTKLSHLETLSLADNGGLGSDKVVERWWPEDLAKLASLTDLDLSLCSVASVPMSWTRLQRLRHLDLSSSLAPSVMKFPAMLSSCTSLERLKLSDLRWETLPLSVCMLTTLRQLVLTNNGLRSLPEELADLTNLQDLQLGHNDFAEFPMILTALTSLEKLSLEGCINMQITCSLNELTCLTRLSILILTCDLSRHKPRWSADSTSRLISLACSLDRMSTGKADILKF